MTFNRHSQKQFSILLKPIAIILTGLFLTLFFSTEAIAEEGSGELLYKKLSVIANSGDNVIIEDLNVASRGLDWSSAEQLDFKGHLRFLSSSKEGNIDETRLFFIRSAAEGNIYILSIPSRDNPDYADLEDLIESKLIFSIKVLESEIGGETYQFAQFVTVPVQPAFDKNHPKLNRFEYDNPLSNSMLQF